LDSVLAQTYTNWECIIVDAHSFDHTWKIIKRYSQQYPGKIKIYSNLRKGACAARNIAFEKSSGKYIQYLDADDLISDNKLEIQVNILEEGGVDIVFGKWFAFTENKENFVANNLKIYKSHCSGVDFLTEMWLNDEMVVPHAWLCERTLILKAGNWNESLLKNQDGEFFCRVILNTEKIGFEKNSISFYRSNNPNSITGSSTYSKAASTLKSYIICQNCLFAVEESKRTHASINRLLSNFIRWNFNLYPDLVNVALLQIKKNGQKPLIYGGNIFYILTRILGFNTAMKIKKILIKLLYN
jgi:glycosyltransferase involved in cell wall biosynthesis